MSVTYPTARITLLVTWHVADCESAVAVIVALPTATGVTRPLDDTVVTAGLLLLQVTDAPEFDGETVAESEKEFPPISSVSLVALSVIPDTLEDELDGLEHAANVSAASAPMTRY